jgi:hypothetical protein
LLPWLLKPAAGYAEGRPMLGILVVVIAVAAVSVVAIFAILLTLNILILRRLRSMFGRSVPFAGY